jgi:hypothetical protein
MTYTDQACPCGSGFIARWQCDKNHVPLFRTCRSCHRRKMAKYRDELRDKPLEPENEWEAREAINVGAPVDN